MNGKGPDNGLKTFVPAVLPKPWLLVGPWQECVDTTTSQEPDRLGILELMFVNNSLLSTKRGLAKRSSSRTRAVHRLLLWMGDWDYCKFVFSHWQKFAKIRDLSKIWAGKNAETRVDAKVDARPQPSLPFLVAAAPFGEKPRDGISIPIAKRFGFATAQRLGTATNYSTGFQSSQFRADGLLGMGYESLLSYEASPIFKSLLLLRLAKSGSELYIGGMNQAHNTGTFTYMPITTRVGIHDDDDAFGSVVTGRARSTVFLSTERLVVRREGASIDTGTAQVVGDARSIQVIYAQIPGSKDAGDRTWTNRLVDVWEVPCDSSTPISITFSGKAFEISVSTFNLGLQSSGSSDCVGGFGASDGLEFWIIGDVFLHSVYAHLMALVLTAHPSAHLNTSTPHNLNTYQPSNHVTLALNESDLYFYPSDAKPTRLLPSSLGFNVSTAKHQPTGSVTNGITSLLSKGPEEWKREKWYIQWSRELVAKYCSLSLDRYLPKPARIRKSYRPFIRCWSRSRFHDDIVELMATSRGVPDTARAYKSMRRGWSYVITIIDSQDGDGAVDNSGVLRDWSTGCIIVFSDLRVLCREI
ncbi:aspartic peptidase domain-containing protein [Lactarius akahatsu]|uniref:Aspartic peptidase domain-containing protein n=1 Tax=Lactarius akahatsu TaxID=416441 RepID=A0AAD4LKB8_9AGAM|nr:aspartic peptidase domain-containing protein [Lactarius akahatsu]